MNEVQSVGFFIIFVMIVVSVGIGFGVANYVAKYLAKKTQEQRELEEARRMFEQRIALKPKHMGARHASVGSVNFEPRQEFEVKDD